MRHLLELLQTRGHVTTQATGRNLQVLWEKVLRHPEDETTRPGATRFVEQTRVSQIFVQVILIQKVFFSSILNVKAQIVFNRFDVNK